MLSPGDTLGDRYRLDGRVASGGMGEVWRATDTVLGRGVAVKLLDAHRADDPGFRSRFRHEARAMAMLHHPGVVDVYDYGETADGRAAYIVMAYVDGQPLDRRIAEAGRLGPGETMSIVAQAAQALHAGHAAGIVHRDVKPGNLVLRPDGTVVLVDFGISRSSSSTMHTGADELIGTARYIAPEQVAKQDTGPATDVYALGVVAYHCLAGRPPFPGDNPLTVALSHLDEDPPPLPADVPGPVRALVTTAMAKNPADRFGTAADMARAAAGAAAVGAAADAVGDAATVGAGAGAGATGAGATTRVVPAGGIRAVAVPGTAQPPRGGRRGPKAWALALLALATAGVVFSLAAAGLFSRDPSIPPSQSPGPSGSAGVGQVEDPSGSGAAGRDPDRSPGPRGNPGEATSDETGAGGPDPGETGGPGPEPSGPPDEPTEPPDEPDPTPTQPADDGTAGGDGTGG